MSIFIRMRRFINIKNHKAIVNIMKNKKRRKMQFILFLTKKNKQIKKRRNLNVDTAYLHVEGDMIMRIGVVIAAIVIYLRSEYKIIDLICTNLFSIIICITVYPIFKNCI